MRDIDQTALMLFKKKKKKHLPRIQTRTTLLLLLLLFFLHKAAAASSPSKEPEIVARGQKTSRSVKRQRKTCQQLRYNHGKLAEYRNKNLLIETLEVSKTSQMCLKGF